MAARRIAAPLLSMNLRGPTLDDANGVLLVSSWTGSFAIAGGSKERSPAPQVPTTQQSLRSCQRFFALILTDEKSKLKEYVLALTPLVLVLDINCGPGLEVGRP